MITGEMLITIPRASHVRRKTYTWPARSPTHTHTHTTIHSYTCCQKYSEGRPHSGVFMRGVQSIGATVELTPGRGHKVPGILSTTHLHMQMNCPFGFTRVPVWRGICVYISWELVLESCLIPGKWQKRTSIFTSVWPSRRRRYYRRGPAGPSISFPAAVILVVRVLVAGGWQQLLLVTPASFCHRPLVNVSLQVPSSNGYMSQADLLLQIVVLRVRYCGERCI